MMKAAIIGYTGMLGYAVSEYFTSVDWSVLKISRKEFDLAKDDYSKLEAMLKADGVQVVINCAGVIKPMIAKTAIEDVLKVNTVAPQNIAKICVRNGWKGFHITTDCVYSGLKGNYDEDDFLDATDVYGMSKNGGEPTSIMTLRTSIIGEENGQSRSLIEWARSQKGKDVNGFTNHDWNGVTTLQVAKSIHKIIEKNAYQPGLFHLHSPKTMNKADMLRLFSEVYKLDLKVNPVEAAEKIDRTLATKYSLSRDFVSAAIPDQVKEMQKFFAAIK